MSCQVSLPSWACHDQSGTKPNLVAKIWACHDQSGTKPNLVAKIWATKFGVRLCRLPKLVAKISFKFQHLVNTGLDVGSLIKWLPLKVANTCKLDIIWVVYCSLIVNGSIRHSGQTILLNDRSDRSKRLQSIIDRKANLRSIICRFFYNCKIDWIIVMKTMFYHYC